MNKVSSAWWVNLAVFPTEEGLASRIFFSLPIAPSTSLIMSNPSKVTAEFHVYRHTSIKNIKPIFVHISPSHNVDHMVCLMNGLIACI